MPCRINRGPEMGARGILMSVWETDVDPRRLFSSLPYSSRSTGDHRTTSRCGRPFWRKRRLLLSSPRRAIASAFVEEERTKGEVSLLELTVDFNSLIAFFTDAFFVD